VLVGDETGHVEYHNGAKKQMRERVNRPCRKVCRDGEVKDVRIDALTL
jgi:hypothetical protein